ncbi:hypothetical protein BASA81_001550 [Batrachochytrium salamandrivorans]|nr:hypothetical protein BASA81_001550 [Batrachochytrium salamandrivorans]
MRTKPIPVSGIVAGSFSTPHAFVELRVKEVEIHPKGVLCVAEDLAANPCTIRVHFGSKVATTLVSAGSLVKLQGLGIEVEPDQGQSHPFCLVVSSEDCIVEVTPPKKSKKRSADAAAGATAPKTRTLTPLNSLQVGKHANVYGVVVNTVFPVYVNSDQVRWSLRVVDESLFTEMGIEMSVFEKKSTLAFPTLQHGSIVRVVNAAVSEYLSYPVITLSHYAWFEVLHPTTQQVELFLQDQPSSLPVDWNRVDALNNYFHSTVVPNYVLFNQYTLTLNQLWEMGTLPDSAVDVVVKVRTAPCASLYSFEVVDFDGPTQATVKLGNLDNKDVYWPIVCDAVGPTSLVYVKIRNCLVQRHGNALILLAVDALSEPVGSIKKKTTGFFRLDDKVVFEKPRSPGVAPTFVVPPLSSSLSPSKFISNTLVPLWSQRPLVAQVHQNDAKLPVSLLRHVLQSDSGAGPFRVRVRVVDHFPQQVCNLTRLVNGQFEWAFALLLEDLTGRLDAYVVGGEQGTVLFGLPACNLAENNESASVVLRSLQRLKFTPLSCIECVLRRIPTAPKAFTMEHTAFVQ